MLSVDHGNDVAMPTMTYDAAVKLAKFARNSERIAASYPANGTFKFVSPCPLHCEETLTSHRAADNRKSRKS